MGVHDDLATLRAALEYNPSGPEVMLPNEAAALARVQAELARLESVIAQLDELLALYQDRDGDSKTGGRQG